MWEVISFLICAYLLFFAACCIAGLLFNVGHGIVSALTAGRSR